MAIEGPLRELGIHDVFQLLDLSRKTGALTVTSGLRDNQGSVYFDRGGVIFASVRNNPHPLGELLLRAGKISEADLSRAASMQRDLGDPRRLGEILIEIGAITRRELDRHVRFQIEEVVFELMSWREGYFSFEERPVDDAPAEASLRISTESLLMEGARRIDEWSRIEDKVPHLGVIPVLAPVRDDHPALLDLLPNEWQVLSEIDGGKDLRAIASKLACSEFDVARIAYGLVTTGVIELRNPHEVAGAHPSTVDARPLVENALVALEAGALDVALSSARQAVAADPQLAEARLALARVYRRMGRSADAGEELRRAVQLDALNAAIYLELGYVSAARGDFGEAVASWERYLRMATDAPDAAAVRDALDAAARLRVLLLEHADV